MINQNFEALLFGIIGSIIAAIIIAFVLKVYKSIPKYKRNYLVSLYIKTIQGYSYIGTNKILNYVLSIIPATIFLISLYNFNTLNYTLELAENTLNTNIFVKNKIKENKQTLENSKTELRDAVVKGKSLLVTVKILLIVSALWFYWLILYRIPYIRQRDKFSFEYKRLRNLLFTLILKDEKIKLYNLEMQVVDENTLKEYTVLLIEYAEKNKIHCVKNTMWLWD